MEPIHSEPERKQLNQQQTLSKEYLHIIPRTELKLHLNISQSNIHVGSLGEPSIPSIYKKNKSTSHYLPQTTRGTKSVRIQVGSTVLIKEQLQRKKVLVLYTSGSAGAKPNLSIVRGYFEEKIRQNQYICDEKMLEYLQEPNLLVTPEQQNGGRLLYKIEQLQKISNSINVSLDTIRLIAQKIYENYNKYYAFIIICGFDVICHISTIMSFMFQNLSKLVIFTGGYFPVSYMRNDTVNNLIQSFAIISMADNFNDVIIVCKNKGYRSNRSIKMKEGQFGSVTTPNLQPLVSVNIKIKFRQHLFLPTPKQPFRVWTNISNRVGIIKFHMIMTKQALEYQLNNPSFDGYVIESYGSSNLPENLQFLNLFKHAAEKQDKIFVNVGQPVQKVNTSMMKEYLEQFYIYYGGDMTTEAALSKLSYLLSKKLNRVQVKKQIETNLRGELTEIKKQNQFQLQNESFMELVKTSLMHYYPLNHFNGFIQKVEDEVTNFIVYDTNPKVFEQLFRQSHSLQNQDTYFNQKMTDLINKNHLLHKAVKASNQHLYRYFLNFNIEVNQEDEQECTALYYAVANKDKKAVQCLLKKGCFVECPKDNLFDLIIKQLKTDNVAFFELLYHIEFKETLREQVDWEGRSVLHKAAIQNASNCIKYLLQKFKINPKLKDKYEQVYGDYLGKNRKVTK